MSASRRTLLLGHAELPSIGGAVTLIGAPTASSAAVADQLLDTYNEWLNGELVNLVAERARRPPVRQVRFGNRRGALSPRLMAKGAATARSAAGFGPRGDCAQRGPLRLAVDRPMTVCATIESHADLLTLGIGDDAEATT